MSNDSGVIENIDFHGFRRYVFGSFGNQAKAIISAVRSTVHEYLSKSKSIGLFFYLSTSKSSAKKLYLSKSKK